MRQSLLAAALALSSAAGFADSKAAPAKSQAQRGPCNPYTQGSWSTQAAIPSVGGMIRGWGVYYPDNGRFYVMGGRTSDTAGSDLVNPREYDPVGDAWVTKTAAFADAQVNNMVGGVLNVGGANRIVVVGGSAAGATTATGEVRHYDPVGDAMTTIATDPWPGASGGTTLPGGGAVFNNRLYVFGGFVIGVSMASQVWEYDPNGTAGARWTLKTATLPAPRGYIPAATSGGFIYLMGGSDFMAGALNDTTSSLRYDPVGDVLTTIATIPRAVAETRAVTQPLDGSIWVLSGGRTPPNPTTQVDVYMPGGNNWITAPALPTARRNFPADVDAATGRIWAVGGYDAANAPTILANEEFNCVVPVELLGFGIE